MNDDAGGAVETGRPPDHSVLRDQRLVAYVWRQSEGVLRFGAAGPPICEVPFAEIVSFDKSLQATLVALIDTCANIDALLFELGMEGLVIVAGDAQPNARLRRF